MITSIGTIEELMAKPTRLLLLTALSCSLSLSGCGFLNELNGIGGQPHSYELTDESLSLTLNKPEFQANVAPLVAVPVLIGIASNAVKAALDAEANRYTAQYAATAYASDFWTVDTDARAVTGLKCTYTGCTLTRTVGGAAASDIEFTFGTADGKTPFVPVYLNKITLTRAKAKVGWPDSNVKVTITLVQNVQYMDGDGTAQQKDVSTMTYIVNVPLGKSWQPQTGVQIGTLVAIPAIQPPKSGVTPPSTKFSALSASPDIGDFGGPTKLTLTVTESDVNGATNAIEMVSTLVGNAGQAISGSGSGKGGN
jgi:hypothetical protein